MDRCDHGQLIGTPCEPCETRQKHANEWKLLASIESGGLRDFFGVKILVKLNRDLNDQDSRVGYRALRTIEEGLCMETARLDPKTEEFRIKEKAEIEKVFADAGFLAIYMEPIPNEYFGDKDPWSLRSPWYTVTTTLGHFKVGWRKRVFVLNWERTTLKDKIDGNTFFSDDVTKDKHMIHCWGYEKAVAYLTKMRLT